MKADLMDRMQIEDVVVAAIRVINQGRTPEHRLAENAQAALYGAGSPLDSLGLVALLIEVEEGMREVGAAISLSDERAVSQKHSPFRSARTLVDYIAELLAERV